MLHDFKVIKYNIKILLNIKYDTTNHFVVIKKESNKFLEYINTILNLRVKNKAKK